MQYPMEIINSTGWYITLPTPRGEHGSPDTVKQPQLATYAGEFFYFDAARGGAVFKAPTDGATTKNSFNPRSELREMAPDGKTQAAWSSTVGTHEMRIVQSVDVLPQGSKPVVVTGQIHDAGDDVTVFRVEGNTTGDRNLAKIWITDGNTTQGRLVDPAYRLGSKYSVGFQVKDGRITYTYNGAPVAGYSQAKQVSGCYFKAGSYCQSGGNITKQANGEADYAQVTIYSVEVCHDGQCSGGAGDVVVTTDPTAPTDPPNPPTVPAGSGYGDAGLKLSYKSVRDDTAKEIVAKLEAKLKAAGVARPQGGLTLKGKSLKIDLGPYLAALVDAVLVSK